MCLIAMAWGTSAQFPLVIAANRDELYARPTAPLAQWTAHVGDTAASQLNTSQPDTIQPNTSPFNSGHTIISGRDLQDGGTWMGFSPSGRFAMLTNVRNPAATVPSQPLSRGHLVVDWLSSQATAADWAAERDFAAYAGFNLIVGDWSNQQLHYLSNQARSQTQGQVQDYDAQVGRSPAASAKTQALQSGHIVGLSNAALSTPWPKTTRLTAVLGQALNAADTDYAQSCVRVGEHTGTGTGASAKTADLTAGNLTARLQHALQDRQPAPDATLPHTGVRPEQEKMLSSIMVSSPTYGTRTSLVAVLDQRGILHLLETTHSTPPLNAAATQRSLAIQWPMAR
jgi:uncharacterized protein with NRDE domain